jgi:hypothetical protein
MRSFLLTCVLLAGVRAEEVETEDVASCAAAGGGGCANDEEVAAMQMELLQGGLRLQHPNVAPETDTDPHATAPRELDMVELAEYMYGDSDVNIETRANSSSEDSSRRSLLSTRGSSGAECDTAAWASHFAKDAHDCGMSTGGRQPGAGNCARGRFHTSYECANCIGNFIDCGRKHCSMKCCLGSCGTKYKCQKCSSDYCAKTIHDCTGGFTPPGLWLR